jgi:hypothetical protein
MKNFWDKLLSKISSLLKNGGNYWSSNRFAFLLAVIISNLAIFGVWIGLSLINNTLMIIDWTVLTLYGMANGLSITSKLVQKNMEKKKTGDVT